MFTNNTPQVLDGLQKPIYKMNIDSIQSPIPSILDKKYWKSIKDTHKLQEWKKQIKKEMHFKEKLIYSI